VQRQLLGFWAADDSTGYNTYDENGTLSCMVVIEFTDDFHYLMYECMLNDEYSLTYEPVAYSIEDKRFRVEVDGLGALAAVTFSEDGQTMYWQSGNKTDIYLRMTEEKARELGIPEYNPAQWTETESGTDNSDASGTSDTSDTTADSDSSDGSDTEAEDGEAAEAAALTFTEPASEDIEKLVNKLDPSLKYRENRESINISETPSVIAETEDGEVVLYGMYLDRYPLVFIEHDGVVDSFEQRWLTPRAILPQVMHEDIDGDGEKELAVSYYGGSGSGVAVMDLVIYERLANGHFSEYSFDAVNALEKAVEYSIDSDVHTLSFSAGDKSLNSEFTDELYPEGIEEVHWGNDIEYELKDGKITLIAAPNASWHYEGMPCVTAQVVYAGDNADIEITDMSLFY